MKKKNYNIKVLMILVAVLICCGWSVLRFSADITHSEEEKEEEISMEIDPALLQGPSPLEVLVEEPELAPLPFYEAKAENPDVYAWIDIEDSNIHYPILQHKSDDAYYLNHTIDGAAGYPGSIYTESVNAKDFSDYNTVIYGHNMKDGSMFKHIHKFKDREFFDNHEYITVYTETDMLIYRVYAVVVYSDRHILKKYDFKEESDRIAFIESLNTDESWNQFRDQMVIDENSKLLTLATCIGGRPNNRLLLVCELVEK